MNSVVKVDRTAKNGRPVSITFTDFPLTRKKAKTGSRYTRNTSISSIRAITTLNDEMDSASLIVK
jgi:hypothetical protein